MDMMIELGISGGLFWTAFLAATVLPLSSEAALSAALLGGAPPLLCLLVATAGNTLGSLTTFYLGHLGKLCWLEKYCRIKPDQIDRMQTRIGRYGLLAAFCCFLPFVGDVMAVTLGFMRYSFWRFLLAMALGKFLRYAVWIFMHDLVMQ